MDSISIFLLLGLAIIGLPPIAVYFLRLKSLIPLVVLQIAMGLMLGPSVFGNLSAERHAELFSPPLLVGLSTISSLAALFFVFTTGMHLSFSSFRGKTFELSAVSLFSVLVPAALGILGGLWIAGRHPGEIGDSGDVLGFALGIGICTGVTALPVLAEILRELQLLKQRIGQYALAIAAFNDAAAWVLLAIVLGLASHADSGLEAVAAPLKLAAYVSAMLVVARPLLVRLHVLVARAGHGTAEGTLIMAVAVAIASATLSEWLGLHYILGAFVAGMVMPEEARKAVLERLQPFTITILVPFFFITTGLKTEIAVGSPNFIEILLLMTTIAIVGKIAGVAIAARFNGETWRFSLGLGALTQTKGLMEVVVATILLDAGVISNNTFSAVVVMALISTAIAMPLTKFFLKDRRAPAPVDAGGGYGLIAEMREKR